MTEQPVNETNYPAPPVDVGPVIPDEPLTSVQSQVGLLLAAVATLISFIFHKDFSPLVPALTTLAFTIYGSAVALARAWKHRTIVQARLDLHAMAQDTPPRAQVQAAFDSVGAHMADIQAQVDALQATKKPAQKATSAPTRGRSASRTRKTATAR
jgi:hypothetical protein